MGTAALIGPVFLAILTCVGQIKANPTLAWIPVDLTPLVAATVAILIVLARANRGPTSGRIVIPIILWILFIPPIIWSPTHSYATVKLIILFSVTLILAVAPFHLLGDERQQRAFLATLAVVAMFFAAAGLLFGPELATDYNNRIQVEGANTIGTARVAMAGAVIMILYACQSGTRNFTRLLLLGASLLATLLGIMTGSRGPTTAAVVAILVTLLFAPAFKKHRGRALLGAAIPSAVAVWMAVRSGSDGMFRIISGAETPTSTRNAMWDDSLRIIGENPFGIGWGAYLSPGLEAHRYPHNLILEIGVEAGWIPMLATACLLVATFARGVKVSATPAAAAIFGVSIFAGINAMVSGDINDNRLLWPTLFALWAIASNRNDNRPLHSRVSTSVAGGAVSNPT